MRATKLLGFRIVRVVGPLLILGYLLAGAFTQHLQPLEFALAGARILPLGSS